MCALQLVDAGRARDEADELNAARPLAFDIATVSHGLLPVARKRSSKRTSACARFTCKRQK